MVIIGYRNGQHIGSANVGDLDEARYLAHNWLMAEEADEVKVITPGQPTRTIYS